MKYRISFFLVHELAHLYLDYDGLIGDSHPPEFHNWNDLVVAKRDKARRNLSDYEMFAAKLTLCLQLLTGHISDF